MTAKVFPAHQPRHQRRVGPALGVISASRLISPGFFLVVTTLLPLEMSMLPALRVWLIELYSFGQLFQKSAARRRDNLRVMSI